MEGLGSVWFLGFLCSAKCVLQPRVDLVLCIMNNNFMGRRIQSLLVASMWNATSHPRPRRPEELRSCEIGVWAGAWTREVHRAGEKSARLQCPMPLPYSMCGELLRGSAAEEGYYKGSFKGVHKGYDKGLV